MSTYTPIAEPENYGPFDERDIKIHEKKHGTGWTYLRVGRVSLERFPALLDTWGNGGFVDVTKPYPVLSHWGWGEAYRAVLPPSKAKMISGFGDGDSLVAYKTH